MEERFVRYGVVNVVERAKYERLYQVPYGYHFMTFNEAEAITACRKKKNPNWVVEKIFHTNDDVNKTHEIFRSGKFEEKKGK